MSVKLFAGTVKLKARSCAAAWSPMGAATTGGSFTLATATVKVWLADAPAMSVAVTVRPRSPTSPLDGVPLKVLVAASKLNHAGSALSSAVVALRVR